MDDTAFENMIVPFDQGAEEPNEEQIDEDTVEGQAEIAAEALPQARVLGAPKSPTREEYVEHSVSHIPHQPWCAHCVRSRGREAAHRKLEGERRTPNVISFDYCFVDDVGQNVQERGALGTLTVGVDHDTGLGFACQSRQKGKKDAYCALYPRPWNSELHSTVGRRAGDS